MKWWKPKGLRMNNMNKKSVHPEPVEGCRSSFENLRTNGFFPNVLSKVEGRAHHKRSLANALVQVICTQPLKRAMKNYFSLSPFLICVIGP